MGAGSCRGLLGLVRFVLYTTGSFTHELTVALVAYTRLAPIRPIKALPVGEGLLTLLSAGVHFLQDGSSAGCPPAHSHMSGTH